MESRDILQKNCPQNQKGVHLISEIQNELYFHISDSESEFSEQEEPTDFTLLALQVLDEVFAATPVQIDKKTYPQAFVHILLDKYSQPIPLIAIFDTGGAALSIMKKDILPDKYWTPYVHESYQIESFLLFLGERPLIQSESNLLCSSFGLSIQDHVELWRHSTILNNLELSLIGLESVFCTHNLIKIDPSAA